jgi:hypothetical protein
MFRDDTHPPEVEAWLVSYTIGDMAQCFYATHGDTGNAFHACTAETLDGQRPLWHGTPVARAIVECCDRDSGASKPQRKELISRSAWCSTTVCPTH